MNTVLPREVYSFALAKANDLVPPIGPTPPRPIPGVSALQRVVVLSVGAAILLVCAMLTTSVLHDVAAMRAVAPVVFLGGGTALAFVAVRLQQRVFRELQHGYTTVRFQFGRARGDRWQQQTMRGGRLAWDYRGTWYLRSDGSVRAAPLTDVDAPGYYPSPLSPGRYELWTGVQWSGRLQPQ